MWSKKYGCELARFTHQAGAVVFASKNGWDESVRYLSLHDNRYLRYFKGHRERVVSLQMAPRDDQLLSAGLDDTVRLWALNSPQCVGLLRTGTKGARPVLAYDPQGLVFAVGAAASVRLYDSRSFENGPFATFHVPSGGGGADARAPELSALHFSPDGRFLLLPSCDAATGVQLLDAFTGERVQSYTTHVNETGLPLDARFTPDGQHVLGASEDGTVRVWRRADGHEVASLAGHAGPVLSLAVNPRYAMFASACNSLAFWLPSDADLAAAS